MISEIKLCIIFSLSFSFLLFGNVYYDIDDNTAFAQTGSISSTQYEIRVKDTTYSQFIPLYGTFSVHMEYKIPIEIHSTELIHAGDSFDMLITVNNPGKLVTEFRQDENILGIFEDELRIGEEKTISIPESWVGQVFAMPKIQVIPATSGPAIITPKSSVFDSETTKQFQVFVDDDIKEFDSFAIDLDLTVNMKNGGNINLGIAEIPLGEHISDMKTSSIKQNIQLKKIIPTNLHLQIKQGDLSEHVKVKAVLTDDHQIPIHMSTNSIEIYVDGVPQHKIIPSVWSDDIFVGDGTHNFQARFSESQDSDNIAITYANSDSAIQTMTLLSNSTSNLSQLQCEQDMIMKDGQCVKQESDGIFGSGGGCLIATATYGTELAPQVQHLREIRDDIVMSTGVGEVFMTEFNQIYYSFSPYIADIQRENSIAREITKIVIYPMLITLHIMEFADKGSEIDVFILGTVTILANLTMYGVAPVVGIYHIRKSMHEQK